MADFEAIAISSPADDDKKKYTKKKKKKKHDLHLDEEEDDVETLSLASSSHNRRGRSRESGRRAALEVEGSYHNNDNNDNDGGSYDDSEEYSSDDTDDGDDDDEAYELTDHTPSLQQRSFFLCCHRIWRPKDRNRCLVLLTLTFLAICTVYYFNDGTNNPNSLRRPPPGAVGVGHASYDTIESTFVEEYNARLTLYKHRSTGAEFLAFVPDSTRKGSNSNTAGNGGGYDPKPDKVFGIAFRTKPESSTGVPHILEHSVLCGSKKYPSRDPFAYLLKGSLQTFLNAFTYPDRTVYPVASRNRADFYNLMDVYLDAVFHPRAVEEEGWWVLRQEGWRYDVVGANEDGTVGDDNGNDGGERERDLADIDYGLDSMIDRADFEYKGVVFSEMKGAYSDPEGLIDRISQTLLFPDNSYRYDSGGDPAVIPTLTREEFVSFYKKYYHPTNSRLFVAGDESDVYHALSVADRYMSPMGYNPDSRKDSAIVYQKRTFHKPVFERRPYAAAPGEGDSGYMLCITWLLNTQPTTSMMQLAWIVLDSLLLGKSSSPLTKALEDSNLGESTIGGGLDDSLLQSTFSIGMKGLKKREDVNVLEVLIMNTLQKLDSDGFSEDEIASCMNTIEFQLREGGGGLRGMEIFLGALAQWNYDQSPREAIIYEDALKLLKEEIERTGSNLFQQMIRDTLISNNHRVALELYPSATLEEEQLQDQKIQISTAQSRMSDVEYLNIVDEGINLKKLQAMEETPEVVASNPQLSINDIDINPVEYPIHVEDNFAKSGIQLVLHEVESDGIVYVDFGLDVSMVPYDEIMLLSSLIALLNEAGTSDMSDAEFRYVGILINIVSCLIIACLTFKYDSSVFRNYIGKVTGGVSANLLVMSVKPTGWDDDIKVLPGVNILTMLFIKGKCTAEKISDLFGVFEKILMDVNLDSKDILRNALKSDLSGKKSSLTNSGHSYADTRMRGRYSVRNYLGEKMNGFSSLDSSAAVLEAVDADWGQFVLRLDKMRQAIINGNRNGMILNLTGDRYVLDATMEIAEDFLVNKLPVDLGNPAPPTPDFRFTEHPWVAPAREEMMTAFSSQGEGIAVPTQVAYVGEGGRMYGVGETVSGSASVVSHYLSTGYMWDVIRAKNGAYGAYSKFSDVDGIGTFYTYRDPNTPDTTLGLFNGAAQSVLDDVESSALTRDNKAAITTAIIGTIGGLDGSALSPHAAGWEALIRYLYGGSTISRQRHRNEILKTTVDDFVDYAQRVKGWREQSIAIVASLSAFNEMQSRTGQELSVLVQAHADDGESG